MKCVITAWLIALALTIASGCVQDNLARYTPVGQGKGTFPSLSAHMAYYSVYGDYGYYDDYGGRESRDEESRQLKYILDHLISHRPSSPGFRSLCALVNTHLVQWDRLVVVEVLSWHRNDCKFIAIAVTPKGLKTVTTERRDTSTSQETPHSLPVDSRKFAACLAELDLARAHLDSHQLFWFDNVDWPVFILHDIMSNGDVFTFGLSGDPAVKKVISYAEAAKVLDKICGPAEPLEPLFDDPIPPIIGPHAKNPFLKSPAKIRDLVPDGGSGTKGLRRDCVPDGSPEAKELRLVGGVYAALLARIWESTLGVRQYWLPGGEASEMPPVHLRSETPPERGVVVH